MLSDNPAFLYAMLDPEYFENIERYSPADEYSSVVDRYLESPWTLQPKGFWTTCTHPDRESLTQGWKIHISGTQDTATDTLERVVPLLVPRLMEFKFCSDRLMLELSINKNWARTGAGKFMTIYPKNDDEFIEIIEHLHQKTKDLQGPYILSDRPYKDSRVVFYRYGEHYGMTRVDPYGNPLRGIQSPDGEWISDERRPYFHVPHWVKDPFTELSPPAAPGKRGVLLKDRYRATVAQKFSATGGIYLAEDTHTGQQVVIREARPMTGDSDASSESFKLLEKEARILQRLGPTGYLPQFVDIFQEWEHRFLVQEKLNAESLWGYSINFVFESEDVTPGDSYISLRETIREIVTGLKTVHEHKVILRDLTKTNVMFTEDDHVKFIDLEFAYELDGDEPPVLGWTTGYASPQQLRNEKPSPKDDYYALGALILDMINFTASGYQLNRQGILDSFRLTLEDLRWPRELYDVVVGLTDPDPESRWDLDRTLDALDKIPVPTCNKPLFLGDSRPLLRAAAKPELVKEIAETIEGITRFILDSADYEREDRLWPASAEVFMINPVSILHGTAGIAYYLWRVTEEVPARALDWTVEALKRRVIPPSLYCGLAGVAVVFLELGQEELAREVLAAGASSELILQDPSLYYGTAGWGLANLIFWRRTGERSYLETAVEMGNHLVRTGEENERGISWKVQNLIPLGFAQGQSGIATFLAFLHRAQSDENFLDTAVKALDFDLSYQQLVAGTVNWYPHTESGPGEPKSPHMRFGTAGVGSAALRCYVLTGEKKYRELIELAAYTVAQRYTNKIWYDFGLAGFGEFLLDMHWFLGDERYLNNAFYLSEALLRHRIPKGKGIAFAGTDLFRISCDFTEGSAGIGLFLHRLLHPQTPRFLMLDELLVPERQRAPSAAIPFSE